MKLIRKEITEYYIDEANRLTKKVIVETLTHSSIDKRTTSYSSIPLYEVTPQ